MINDFLYPLHQIANVWSMIVCLSLLCPFNNMNTASPSTNKDAQAYNEEPFLCNSSEIMRKSGHSLFTYTKVRV
jgi:hypothetical protein